VKGNKEMAKGTTTKAEIQEQEYRTNKQMGAKKQQKGQCRHWATEGQRRHTYINKFALRRGEVRVIIKTEQTEGRGGGSRGRTSQWWAAVWGAGQANTPLVRVPGEATTLGKKFCLHVCGTFPRQAPAGSPPLRPCRAI